MQAAQYAAFRFRLVVLHEPHGPHLCVESGLRVAFEEVSSRIPEDIGFEDHYAFYIRLYHFHRLFSLGIVRVFPGSSLHSGAAAADRPFARRRRRGARVYRFSSSITFSRYWPYWFLSIGWASARIFSSAIQPLR